MKNFEKSLRNNGVISARMNLIDRVLNKCNVPHKNANAKVAPN